MGRLERDALFRNNGDGTFTDATAALGLGNIGKGHGVTFGDIDTDGDVDIYVPVGGCVYRGPSGTIFSIVTSGDWKQLDHTKTRRD